MNWISPDRPSDSIGTTRRRSSASTHPPPIVPSIPARSSTRSVAPEDAPDNPTEIEIAFERGDPVAVDGEKLSPAALLTRLGLTGDEDD